MCIIRFANIFDIFY